MPILYETLPVGKENARPEPEVIGFTAEDDYRTQMRQRMRLWEEADRERVHGIPICTTTMQYGPENKNVTAYYLPANKEELKEYLEHHGGGIINFDTFPPDLAKEVQAFAAKLQQYGIKRIRNIYQEQGFIDIQLLGETQCGTSR